MDPRKWINYVRNYGPHAKNVNMFDEKIQRTTKKSAMVPLNFTHPYFHKIRNLFDAHAGKFTSMILTGDAGDGKTHLCRQIWEELGGGKDTWSSNDPLLTLKLGGPNFERLNVHFLRDLSAWVPQKGCDWPPERKELLTRFSASIFADNQEDYFFIACNDGQLTETWKRLGDDPAIARTAELIETLLVENRQNVPEVNLHFFNLSRVHSAELFDLVITAFLEHPGWMACLHENGDPSSPPHQVFMPGSPIRTNYEILKDPHFQQRIRILFELCDYNNIHVSIRQILLFLSNALLGHKGCQDKLMRASDVQKIVRESSEFDANIFNNLFGANLSKYQQDNIFIYRQLCRYRIGLETTNAIDELLIYGNEVEHTKPFFNQLMGQQAYFGADAGFIQSQNEYVEAADEGDNNSENFLEKLIAHRRGLFFKLPDEWIEKYPIWSLTVFKYGGEYRTEIIEKLKILSGVKREITQRLVKGLNRIFVGMLISYDKSLFLASSLSFSNARISRILEDEIPVSRSRGMGIDIVSEEGKPFLSVIFNANIETRLELHLTRYEFLSRVAEGALPNSFSKECYEDIMAFKSKVLADARRSRSDIHWKEEELTLKIINLDANGKPCVQEIGAYYDL